MDSSDPDSYVTLGERDDEINLFVVRFTYESDIFSVDVWLNPDDQTDFTQASNCIIADSAEAPTFNLIAFRSSAPAPDGEPVRVDQRAWLFFEPVFRHCIQTPSRVPIHLRQADDKDGHP